MSGILAFSIYKTSDGTTYQMDGHNISPDSLGYSAERVFQNTTKGTERKSNIKHTFEIRHNNSTFHTNFEDDSDVENMVWRMTGIGSDRFFLWYEDSKVNVVSEKSEADPEGDPFPYTLRMESFGTAIASGVNLLHAYAKTQGFTTAWGDSDSDNEADIFTFEAFISKTFSSGQQTLETNTTKRAMDALLEFPISGIEFTFSFDIDSLTGSYNANRIHIEFLNFAGSVISSSFTNLSNTGRKSQVDISDATTYKILFRHNLSSSSGSVTSVISDPAVRLNGSTIYVDG